MFLLLFTSNCAILAPTPKDLQRVAPEFASHGRLSGILSFVLRTKVPSMRSSLAVCGVILGSGLALSVRADSPTRWTQRRINQTAARIEQALIDVLETPRLRRPGESVREYCLRLTAKQPEEVAAAHSKRLQSYADSLARGVPAETSNGKLPALDETSVANTARWQRLMRTFAYLPKRLTKLRATIRANQPTASEFEQTLALLLAARNDLRDARP
jgi:hypothetical protein